MIAALALTAIAGGSGSSPQPDSGPLPAITAAAPAHAEAQIANCAKVLEQLPVTLGKLAPRVVHTTPDTPNVVAWGEPAIVLSCGVGRPKDLVAGSDAKLQAGGDTAGPYYDITESGSSSVWTTVDRAAYIAIAFPSSRQPADYLPLLSAAIAKALPAVCTTDDTTPDLDTLCTRRR